MLISFNFLLKNAPYSTFIGTQENITGRQFSVDRKKQKIKEMKYFFTSCRLKLRIEKE